MQTGAVSVGLELGLVDLFLHLLVPSNKCGYQAKSMKKEEKARLIGSAHRKLKCSYQ